jgi:hypothetical protein
MGKASQVQKLHEGSHYLTVNIHLAGGVTPCSYIPPKRSAAVQGPWQEASVCRRERRTGATPFILIDVT